MSVLALINTETEWNTFEFLIFINFFNLVPRKLKNNILKKYIKQPSIVNENNKLLHNLKKSCLYVYHHKFNPLFLCYINST